MNVLGSRTATTVNRMSDMGQPTKTLSNGTPVTKSMFGHLKIEHMVAGFTGGVTSTLILHPLDLLKIRFAGKKYLLFIILFRLTFHVFFFIVNDGRNAIPNYAGLGNAVTTIFRQEGIKGLYKGVTPNVWGSGSAWGFYFLLLVNF